jgi:hypothetical protein
VLGHDSTSTNIQSNITIWKIDEKSGNITKVTQNIPREAHEANLTALIFSKEEKFLISLSERG